MSLLSTLTDLGLSGTELQLYELLLTTGPISVANLSEKTSTRRQDLYYRLGHLVEAGIVEEYDLRKIKHYRAKNPQALQRLAEQRIQQAEQVRSSLDGLIPGLTSQFVLTNNRPGVLFYEGQEAYDKLGEHALTATETIKEYADYTAVQQYIPEGNKSYGKLREKKGIKKQVICSPHPDLAGFRATHAPGVTEIRSLADLPSFGAIVQLYDQTMSILTIREGEMVGTIISDELIVQLFKHLFNYHWSLAQE